MFPGLAFPGNTIATVTVRAVAGTETHFLIQSPSARTSHARFFRRKHKRRITVCANFRIKRTMIFISQKEPRLVFISTRKEPAAEASVHNIPADSLLFSTQYELQLETAYIDPTTSNTLRSVEVIQIFNSYQFDIEIIGGSQIVSISNALTLNAQLVPHQSDIRFVTAGNVEIHRIFMPDHRVNIRRTCGCPYRLSISTRIISKQNTSNRLV